MASDHAAGTLTETSTTAAANTVLWGHSCRFWSEGRHQSCGYTSCLQDSLAGGWYPILPLLVAHLQGLGAEPEDTTVPVRMCPEGSKPELPWLDDVLAAAVALQQHHMHCR